MEMNQWISLLERELAAPLPGLQAQLIMSPSGRRPVPGDTPLKNSGVLILLFPYRKLLHLVFIKRAEYEGIHSGQVSFPGGMYEKGDRSLQYTALRETLEETGVPVDAARILGRLTPLHIPVSNINVFPFVAVCQERPDFSPDPLEVQYLIETSLDKLMDPVNHKVKIMNISGSTIEVPYFDMGKDHIWGATAMILSEFLEIARKIIC
ncbi:MAG TPA: CoA pyrophosphatase [Bacteroidales bacterium]|nr:CoA pyrophosphatase [Bacteroidales bacterium]